LGYEYENLDDFYFPKRGWNFILSASAGNKTVTSGNLTDGPNDKSKSIQYSGYTKLQKFSKISKRTTLLSGITVATVQNNKNQLFASDLYRIGGISTLRGFNEKYFYTRDYAVSTLEYRIFLDNTTYFLLFADQGYLYNSLNNKYDLPTGFGAGVSFSTGPGVFSFVYSLGRSADQSVAFNLSKIHFGYIARF
jgi:hemolysin activation/secretion protein